MTSIKSSEKELTDSQKMEAVRQRLFGRYLRFPWINKLRIPRRPINPTPKKG